jgi:hypothetical protein
VTVSTVTSSLATTSVAMSVCVRFGTTSDIHLTTTRNHIQILCFRRVL